MRRLLPLLLFSTSLVAQAPPTIPPPSDPVINPDHTVTFRYTAPATPAISLALENVPAPIPMQRGDDGVWTVTTPALPPELYYYHFRLGGDAANLATGTETLDPHNMEIQYSLTSVSNSFLVPGTPPQPWEQQDIPHGVVHHHQYTSHIVLGLTAGQSDFYVYTPPGYDPRSKTPYPTLYLLHGWSQVAADWPGIGRATQILDTLIASGSARPMVVVMPLGYGDMSFVRQGFGIWQNSVPIDHNTTLFSQALLTEVLPQVQQLYNVSHRREDRAITGLSMGGLESLTIGLTHADSFAWIGGFSAAVHKVTPATFSTLTPANTGLKLLWIACGTGDGLIQANRALAATLKSQGLPVTAVETPGLHTWVVWRDNLVHFAPLLFRQ